MDAMKITGIGFICLAVFALATPGCSRSSGAGIEVSAEAITDNEIHLTLTRNGEVWKSKTIPLQAPGALMGAEFRDGWAVAEFHMNPSSSMFVAWNPETDKTCCSPGCTWLAAKDHFITIHKVHFNSPEDETEKFSLFVDGNEYCRAESDH